AARPLERATAGTRAHARARQTLEGAAAGGSRAGPQGRAPLRADGSGTAQDRAGDLRRHPRHEPGAARAVPQGLGTDESRPAPGVAAQAPGAGRRQGPLRAALPERDAAQAASTAAGVAGGSGQAVFASSSSFQSKDSAPSFRNRATKL